MEQKDKVAILLSTYNSEKYLKEQIDSILSQTYKDWILYIRDDVSIDNTKTIIQSYCARYSNIVFLEAGIENIGVMGSFFWLLENVDAQYYMFCDHDDVWLPFKIEMTYNALLKNEKDNPNKPIIINTDLIVVDSALEVIHESMWDYRHYLPEILKSSFMYLCVGGLCTGCTMMFNKNAKKVSLPISINATMHDYWLALKVMANGGLIVPLYTPTILYRQHENNVLGAVEFQKYYVIGKILNINKLIKQNRRNYKMITSISKVSVISYLFYKIKYYLIRYHTFNNKAFL